jgi:integrase
MPGPLGPVRAIPVTSATWSEINLAERLWTIGSHRMKSDVEHRVPLVCAAIAILKAMLAIRQNEFVFPGAKQGQPLSNLTLLMLLRRMGYGYVTSHGFRATFRSRAAERTSFPREGAEMALAHKIPSAVEAAYLRSDLFQKRRRLMGQSAAYCGRSFASADVVPLQRVWGGLAWGGRWCTSPGTRRASGRLMHRRPFD